MRIRRLCLVASVLCGVVASVNAGDWPQWRGPDRTDVSTEKGLSKAWPKDGPKRVWMYRNAGLGYAGFSVANGIVYTMGAREQQEFAIAIDANTGKEKWATKVGKRLPNRWGDGPRSTPTVDAKHVYVLGGQGGLLCLNAKTGKEVWSRTMQQLGGKTPNWGYTESVLVDGDLVICTPGGKKGAVAALNKRTGKTVWQSEGFTEGAQYSSPIVVQHAGKKQYIQRTMKALVGIDAKSGDVLWKTDFPGRTAMIPTPIYHDGRVYIAGGYGTGCKQIAVDDANNVKVTFENKTMKNHHGGVILVGDHLYGYSDGAGWVCQDWKTGEMVWNDKSLGKGAIACADGMLYLVEEGSGKVALIEATPDGYKESGRFTLSPQTEQRSPSGKIWVHPVIANGKMYLRDQEIVYCYDIKPE